MCKFTGIYILFFIQFHVVKLLFYEKTTTLLYTYHHHYHKRQAHLFVAVAFIVWSLVTRVESNYKKTKHYAKANKLFICRCVVYLICICFFIQINVYRMQHTQNSFITVIIPWWTCKGMFFTVKTVYRCSSNKSMSKIVQQSHGTLLVCGLAKHL